MIADKRQRRRGSLGEPANVPGDHHQRATPRSPSMIRTRDCGAAGEVRCMTRLYHSTRSAAKHFAIVCVRSTPRWRKSHHQPVRLPPVGRSCAAPALGQCQIMMSLPTGRLLGQQFNRTNGIRFGEQKAAMCGSGRRRGNKPDGQRTNRPMAKGQRATETMKHARKASLTCSWRCPIPIFDSSQKH